MNNPFRIHLTPAGNDYLAEPVNTSPLCVGGSSASKAAEAGNRELILREGEYAFNRAAQLRGELTALDGGNWVIDFRNVRYIDSCCLAELIRALKRMHAQDPAAGIDIVNANQLVRSVFAMTCLDTLFHVAAP